MRQPRVSVALLRPALHALVLLSLACTLFYGDVMLRAADSGSAVSELLVQRRDSSISRAHSGTLSGAVAVDDVFGNDERDLQDLTTESKPQGENAADLDATKESSTTQEDFPLSPPAPETRGEDPPSPTRAETTPKLTPATTSKPTPVANTAKHTPAPTAPQHTPNTTSSKPTPVASTPTVYSKYGHQAALLAQGAALWFPTSAPSPTPDAWFHNVRRFPRGAPIHNESFVRRSLHFDATVSRAKGIILCLHDDVLELGLSLIRELRCLGNTELIQVYHCLPRDLSDGAKATLLSQDNRLEIIDVCSDLVNAKVFTRLEAPEFKSYWIKPLAVHHTNLHELILLDADDILLRDPSVLRENAAYRQNGTLFFYDRVKVEHIYLTSMRYTRNTQPLLHYILDKVNYTAFNLTGPRPSPRLLNSFAYQQRSCHEQDSSMVLIDKTREGKALDVLWWLITTLRFGFDFSWGDKETFWLAFELGQQPYAFSPWGVSVVSSSANKDMENHPQTLCGSIAQYMPSDAHEPAELLYVNGKALLDPLSHGATNRNANANATHLVPRMKRKPRRLFDPSVWRAGSTFPSECLVGLGSTPLPPHFPRLLFRRRLHYLAASSGVLAPLAQCEFSWAAE